MAYERFIPFEIATKLIVSLGIGLLVGFEREWSRKDLGVRTFAIVSLLGMLCMLQSQAFAWIGMGAVVVVVTVMNLGNLFLHRELEITTSVALIVVYTLGVLVGEGHIFTPTSAAVMMTLLLALKPQFTWFAGGVTAQELRSAVLLGLIGFVIYPVLPGSPPCACLPRFSCSRAGRKRGLASPRACPRRFRCTRSWVSVFSSSSLKY